MPWSPVQAGVLAKKLPVCWQSRALHVIVSSRKIDGCQAVADAIKADGGSAEAFACHVGELAQIEAVFSHIRDVHGKLDILVNNAAANPFFGHILDTPVDAFDKTVDVNLRGYFYMSVEGARLMREHGGWCHREYRFSERFDSR